MLKNKIFDHSKIDEGSSQLQTLTLTNAAKGVLAPKSQGQMLDENHLVSRAVELPLWIIGKTWQFLKQIDEKKPDFLPSE